MAGNHRRGFSNRISTYLRQAGSYTLLSAAQEEQLSRQIAEGNTQARKAMMPRIHPGYGAFMHEMTVFLHELQAGGIEVEYGICYSYHSIKTNLNRRYQI